MAIDKAAVAHIATLARIRVAEDELARLAGELQHILNWVEQLNEVDTTAVEPLASVTGARLPRRLDEVSDGGCRDKILANAPEAAHGFFAVPKVIE